MPYTMWFLGLLILQVVHLGSTTLQKNDTQLRHCYACDGVACGAMSSARCPPDAPYCATTAESPNLNSSEVLMKLTCSALTATPCVITLTDERQLSMKCVCAQDFCNAPFTSVMLRSHLINFIKHAANYTNEELASLLQNQFKNFSVKIAQSNDVQNSTNSVQDLQPEMPQVAAVKHEPTPSDDEEDEGEGSGNYEESRSNFHPSPPTNPSSYLPANENKALPLVTTSFLPTILLVLIIIA